jgi:hypothetical protein
MRGLYSCEDHVVVFAESRGLRRNVVVFAAGFRLDIAAGFRLDSRQSALSRSCLQSLARGVHAVTITLPRITPVPETAHLGVAVPGSGAALAPAGLDVDARQEIDHVALLRQRTT